MVHRANNHKYLPGQSRFKIRIPLDRHSNIALYQQIEQYLRLNILSGNLPHDTRLPASRKLARDLGVNRITVENAYASLETDGLAFSIQGSGTYVAAPSSTPQSSISACDHGWPGWQQALRPSAPHWPDPDQILQKAGHPDPINLSSGAGDPQSYPVDEFRKFVQKSMRQEGLAAFDYTDPRGYAPLRQTIAQVVASQGLGLHPDHILVTSGSQQALAIICQTLVQPGDTLLVEKPTYSSGLSLFRAYGAQVIAIPTDEQGMQVEQIEPLLQQHPPRLIYCMPTFQNPSGANLSASRRRQLVALAARYNLPIIEDDFVGDLRYDGHAQPALKSLDAGGNVIYISTFSKMLMPGLRVGFLAAEGPVYDQLVEVKRVTDLSSSSLAQRALEAYVTVGRYQAFLRRSCQRYRQRRDRMVQAIQRYLPGETHFTPPLGGLFLWARLPDKVNSEALLPLACQHGMAFMPGTRFFVEPGEGQAYIRLNFACQTPERIEQGIRRLGDALKKWLPEKG